MTAQLDLDPVKKMAVISGCGTYRYRLTRCWDPRLPELRWVMLNPSTADADIDDPTVRKCIGFGKRLGYGSIQIVNVFAVRSTDPREIMDADDPVGPLNGSFLADAIFPPVIFAWGGNVPKSIIADEAIATVKGFVTVLKEVNPDAVVHCLGKTKDGSPRHPLMLAYSTELQPWP